MDEQNTPRIGAGEGVAMIALAFVFDAIQLILAFTVIGYAILWAVSFQAYLIFCIWLGLKRSLGLSRALVLAGTMFGGCVGIPAWGGTIWPLVAKTMAADKLGKITPGAENLINKAAKK